MLIQQRDCIEKNNLKWDSSRKKYELPFDFKELNNYEFHDSFYLGKEKQCIPKVSGTTLEAAQAQELAYKYKIYKEYMLDFSNEIISLIKATLMSDPTRRMKQYLEYFIMKEYRRQGKHTEYRALKKRLVDTLVQAKWNQLAGKVLEEDADFVSEDIGGTGTGQSIEIQLDELTTSEENAANRELKFK
jgi:hypothetical protein